MDKNKSTDFEIRAYSKKELALCYFPDLDPKLGVKYEKYGHLSDCFDYFMCKFLDEPWGRFQSKTSGIATTVGPIYGTFSEY